MHHLTAIHTRPHISGMSILISAYVERPNWFILDLPGEFELWHFNAARATLWRPSSQVLPPSLFYPFPPFRSLSLRVSSHLILSIVLESISVDRHTRQLQRLYRAAVHTLNIRLNL